MYQVKFYRGDCHKRQTDANNDGAVAYIEHHFNSSDSAAPNYSVVVVGSNASQTSRNWGRWYAAAVARAFNTSTGGSDGIVVGGFDGRGDANVKYTRMPAVLLEPLFASNPRQADIIRSEAGQKQLAEILAESVQRFFPGGGLIAFSVGHKYKTSRPNDRGAELTGGGNEADHAEKVLEKAKVILESIGALSTERIIRVSIGGKTVFTSEIDPDSVVSWDPVRGVLNISDSA